MRLHPERLPELERRAKIRRIPVDKKTAGDIISTAETNASVALDIKPTDRTATVIFRELYESIKELGDAFWRLSGYEPLSHDVSLEVLAAEFLCADNIGIERLGRFRLIRHSANYQGYRASVSQAAEISDFWRTCGMEILMQLKRKAGV